MLVGFGFLMTFLRKYGLGAVGLTYLLTVLTLQLTIVFGNFWGMTYEGKYNAITLDVNSLVTGYFGTATVLISFGALIGKVTPTQIAIISFIEIFCYAFNREFVNIRAIKTADMGGTIFIHLFGAYYGLACSWVLGRPNQIGEDKGFEQPSTISDLFSLVGTVFLWIYWPSFNGATAPQSNIQQLRTVVNTVLALSVSCLFSFVFSRLFQGKHKFRPVDIQNATLAGGVAIGASSNLAMNPAATMAVGMIASFISCWGFNRLQPVLEGLGVHDSCGIHNLHGMPALIGTIAVTIAVAYIPSSTYRADEYASIFPAGKDQWLAQIIGGAVTLATAIVCGALTGIFIKNVFPRRPRSWPVFSDDMHWEVAEHEV